MRKKIAFVIKMVNVALVTLVVLLVIAIAGVRLFKITPYVVLSGSMEPEYKTGGIVYTVSVDPEDLKVGDNITFKMDTVIATHQIIQIENEGGTLLFHTKGTANENPDENPVPASRILGKGVFHIPYLGYVASYIQQPPGTYVAIAVGAGLLMLLLLPDLIYDEKEEQKKKKAAEEAAQKESADPLEEVAADESAGEEPGAENE